MHALNHTMPSAARARQIVLRTINSSLSAYLSVTYNAGFFDSYDVLDCNVVQAGLLMKVGAETAASVHKPRPALRAVKNATGCCPR